MALPHTSPGPDHKQTKIASSAPQLALHLSAEAGSMGLLALLCHGHAARPLTSAVLAFRNRSAFTGPPRSPNLILPLSTIKAPPTLPAPASQHEMVISIYPILILRSPPLPPPRRAVCHFLRFLLLELQFELVGWLIRCSSSDPGLSDGR